MLLAIRSLVHERGQVSLTDLALHFRKSPEAMRGMVGHWVAKGQVRKIACGASGCGHGCGGCSFAQTHEIYAWVDNPA